MNDTYVTPKQVRKIVACFGSHDETNTLCTVECCAHVECLKEKERYIAKMRATSKREDLGAGVVNTETEDGWNITIPKSSFNGRTAERLRSAIMETIQSELKNIRKRGIQ